MLLKTIFLTKEEKQKIKTPDLKERSNLNPLADNRKQYLVLSRDGEELAYLSFDILPGKDYIVLYEIFVTKAHRRKGIGNATLLEAENIAKIFCFFKIRVNPKSLSEEVPQERLIEWYKKKGYYEIDRQQLEKILSKHR